MEQVKFKNLFKFIFRLNVKIQSLIQNFDIY